MHFERKIVIEVGHGRRQEELLHTINQYLINDILLMILEFSKTVLKICSECNSPSKAVRMLPPVADTMR